MGACLGGPGDRGESAKNPSYLTFDECEGVGYPITKPMKVLSSKAISSPFVFQIHFDSISKFLFQLIAPFLMIDHEWKNKLFELFFVPHISCGFFE